MIIGIDIFRKENGDIGGRNHNYDELEDEFSQAPIMRLREDFTV